MKTTLPQEIIEAYQSYREVESKYAAYQGYYDRSHSDNVKLGRRWAKLSRLITKHGLNEASVLSTLTEVK